MHLLLITVTDSIVDVNIYILIIDTVVVVYTEDTVLNKVD